MKTSSSSFIDGMLYFWGFAPNPANTILESHFQHSDAERLRGDWYKIGNDIKKIL